MSPRRCFVIMPYGVKDGIDFEEIYAHIIAKAVAEVPDLTCIRCDELDAPGWIADRMITHILEDDIAIVDTTTLNPNVFYELGVRHALRRSVTVLINKDGTTTPFNILGLRSIAYDTAPAAAARAVAAISSTIRSAIADAMNVDSLVYNAIPGLRAPAREPKRLTKVAVHSYPLTQRPDHSFGLISGDREFIRNGDIWVSSENTDMQMDTYFGKSTSATIRYLGAKKDAGHNIVEDTIADELDQLMANGASQRVPPAAVLVTSSGALADNGVKWIFHVASVQGEPREGYKPVTNLGLCVTRALHEAGRPAYAGATSILFPILGTGPGGGDLRTHAEVCFDAAIDWLEDGQTGDIRQVLFYVWSDADLEVCQSIARTHPSLARTNPP